MLSGCMEIIVVRMSMNPLRNHLKFHIRDKWLSFQIMKASEHFEQSDEVAHRRVREPTYKMEAQLNLKELRRQTRALKRRTEGTGDDKTKKQKKISYPIFGRSDR